MMHMVFRVADGVSRNGNTTPQPPGRRARRLGHQCWGPWTIRLLILTSLLLIMGCGDDNDEVRVDVTDVRISNTSSVFRILESEVFEFTEHDGGFLFGVQNGEIEFGGVTMSTDGFPQAPFVVRDFDRLNEELNFKEGEGDMDGEAACRFTVSRSTMPNMAVDNVIACDECDIVIHALGIPRGGSGRGELTWHLAGCRDASDTSQFRSVAVEVTVAVDEAGNLIAIDGIPVQAETMP